MKLTASQEKELARRYVKASAHSQDTVTFGRKQTIRNAYLKELAETAAAPVTATESATTSPTPTTTETKANG